ncbi:Gx transporter family protein [candidate division WOR-3 bacterium]|nr:Gx transporter family protein [candidate division WOR-3 bacterium]
MKIGLRRIIELSLFSTLIIALHAIESLINPTFFRLGLGNALILYLLLKKDVSSAFLTVLLKIAASGFITGSIVSPVFLAISAASMSSFAVMVIFIKVFRTGPIGASVPASCAHNAIVLISAELVIKGIFSSLFPFIFVFSIFSGILTGTAAYAIFISLKNLDTKQDVYKINL